MVLLQVLEADLKAKLTSSGNDVLVGLVFMHCTMGSDLARCLRPSTNLGRSAGFLGSTVTLTTGDTENYICFMLCASLRVENEMVPVKELINTDKTTDVTSGHVLNGLTAAHHRDGPLDGFLLQISPLFRNKIGSHDPGLLSSGHLAREDTAESVEAAFVGGGHHLGDVHHQGAIGVARLHGHSSLQMIIR